MGEYVTYNGDCAKIGTCEELYYIRFDGLLALVTSGAVTRAVGNLEPADYLKPENGFRFRFPFPDEDATMQPFYNGPAYNRGLLVDWPADVHVPEGCSHGQITVTAKAEGDANPNPWAMAYLRLPCPQDATAEANPWPAEYRTRARRLQITQQRPYERALWTVVLRLPLATAARRRRSPSRRSRGQRGRRAIHVSRLLAHHGRPHPRRLQLRRH
jgi:hypothetical protein